MASGFREGRSLLWQLGLILIPGTKRKDRLAAVASKTRLDFRANSTETRSYLRCFQGGYSSTYENFDNLHVNPLLAQALSSFDIVSRTNLRGCKFLRKYHLFILFDSSTIWTNLKILKLSFDVVLEKIWTEILN